MHVRFWGTRGSIAKAGPSTLRFGGNTSCVELRSDAGTLIVIDCGTGAHGLGQALVAEADGAPVDGHILISHTHWDHIQGLPFFAPLFVEGNSWHVYGPRGLAGSLAKTLAGQMEHAYFPVAPEQLAGVVGYHDLVEGTIQIGDVRVTTQYLNHPALTLGYRLEADGVTVVYASDHEPFDAALADGGDLTTSHQDRAHAAFVAQADLLIHDTQYLAAEYPTRVGWGHSTLEYVVATARAGEVARLAMYHHDPGRTDDEVDALVVRAGALAAAAGFTGEIFAAAEGQHLELRGPRVPGEASVEPAATMQPALEELDRSVLIAVHGPEVGALLADAAAAEGLAVLRAGDPDEALAIARTARPSIVLLEEDDDLHELTRRIRTLEDPYGHSVGVVAVTRGGAAHDGADPAVSDWLLWPSSAAYVRTKLHAWILRRACRWQPAPIPPDEARRLGSVRRLGLLDTGPEPRFDRLAEQARRALDTPVALITLIDDDRQWFKSRLGTDVEETPRDLAFCAHAILGDDVLQVPDPLEDDRFADNPLVAHDPRVRFYAGVPLKLSDGSRVGTLCVLDFRPRLLDDAKLAELRRLGDLVVHQLEAG